MKCAWCGKDTEFEPHPFSIQSKTFCSQNEFKQYVDKTFGEITNENFSGQKRQPKKEK